MRFVDLLWLHGTTVPVTSRPVRRAGPPSPQPTGPAVGGRWGRPSDFSLREVDDGLARRIGTIGDDDELPGFKRVIRSKAQIMSEKVRVESPENPEKWVEIDRMERIAFSYVEFPPKAHTGTLQPSRRTTYDLAFDLHPPDEQVVG